MTRRVAGIIAVFPILLGLAALSGGQQETRITGILRLDSLSPFRLESEQLFYVNKGSKSEGSTNIVDLDVPAEMQAKARTLAGKRVVVAGKLDCEGNWQSVQCRMVVREIGPAGGTPAPLPAGEPGDVWQEPVSGMEFVWIPAGKFTMGSNEELEDEAPAHRVELNGFWLGKTEVTQGQWKAVLSDNPSRFATDARLPVESVDWNDTQRFIRALSALSGTLFRLPTEAEWEYACRAGTSGSEYGNLNETAWYDENSKGSTHPVGRKKPNAWGLYDMLGNVWEWCQDWYGRYPGAPQVNPAGPSSGAGRVIRGGCWSALFVHARPVNRGSNDPSDRGDHLGFRLAVRVIPK
jgi:formylglycine-generating enzyme required for sulfatase activity